MKNKSKSEKERPEAISFSLEEISEWNCNEKNEGMKVELPSVQRGFVWKPHQIEDLWDSLLRGYPIGSFAVHKTKDNKYELLDGQQRAISIALGFGKKLFNQKDINIKIFIDMGKPDEGDERKYIFRVITRSHPWGYKRKKNDETLELKERRECCEELGIEDHLKEDINKFFPWDSVFPVPLELFLIGETFNKCLNEINKWLKDHDIVKEKLKTRIKKLEFNIQESETELEKLKRKNINEDKTNEEKEKLKKKKYIKEEYKKLIHVEERNKKIKEIYELINGKEEKSLGIKYAKIIPCVKLDLDRYASKINNEPEDINDDVKDDIENLFIRLNSGGTPLAGEELSYSILKSKISEELKELIEEKCQILFKPSRFITIAYRLYENTLEKQQDSYSMRIRPGQFRKSMENNKQRKGFENFLNEILTLDKLYDGKTLLEYTKDLLKYEKEKNKYGFPYLIVSNLSDSAPELMFMLLYRLYIKNDIFTLNNERHKKMLGMISLFKWSLNKKKTQSNLLANIWPAVKDLKTDDFWSSSTVRRAQIDEVIISLPQKKDLGYFKTKKFKLNKGYIINGMNEKYTEKLLTEKEIILYAQREALSIFFPNETIYDLEDNNLPFDWDHISPLSERPTTSKKKGKEKLLKDIYNYIGNKRAWPLSMNRSDSNEMPPNKFKINEKEQQKIINVMKKEYRIELLNEGLTKKLLELSFCGEDWLNNKNKDYFEAIHKRNALLCEEWYEKLLIGDLLPKESDKIINFDKIINKKWKRISSEKEWKHLSSQIPLKEAMPYDKEFFYYLKNITIDKHKAFIYLYSVSGYLLHQDSIEFGIFYEKSDKYLTENIKLSKEEMKKNNINGFNGKSTQNYYGNFTLISVEDKYFRKLFEDFKEWLNDFPNKNVKYLKKEIKIVQKGGRIKIL